MPEAAASLTPGGRPSGGAAAPLAVLLLVLLAGSGPACAREAEPAAARGALLAALNAERDRSGARSFLLVERLTEVAQAHAEELSRRGSMRFERGSEKRMDERLERAGYLAHAWTESVALSTAHAAHAADAGEVVAQWSRKSRDLHRRVMGDDYRDLGIGIARLDGVPLYVFLFAIPQGEFFKVQTADLSDLEEVRREMLGRVNRARGASGARALRANAVLDRVAQRFAEDMLARSYFRHESPEGTTSRDRVAAAGYQARMVGENIAEGQFSVDEVMAGWLKSPGHRKNILAEGFRELGVGLALGRWRAGYRVIWVQVFGRSQGVT